MMSEDDTAHGRCGLSMDHGHDRWWAPINLDSNQSDASITVTGQGASISKAGNANMLHSLERPYPVG